MVCRRGRAGDNRHFSGKWPFTESGAGRRFSFPYFFRVTLICYFQNPSSWNMDTPLGSFPADLMRLWQSGFIAQDGRDIRRTPHKFWSDYEKQKS